MRKCLYDSHSQSLTNLTTERFDDFFLSNLLPQRFTGCKYSDRDGVLVLVLTERIWEKRYPSLADLDKVSVYDYMQSPPGSTAQLLTGL